MLELSDTFNLQMLSRALADLETLFLQGVRSTRLQKAQIWASKFYRPTKRFFSSEEQVVIEAALDGKNLNIDFDPKASEIVSQKLKELHAQQSELKPSNYLLLALSHGSRCDGVSEEQAQPHYEKACQALEQFASTMDVSLLDQDDLELLVSVNASLSSARNLTLTCGNFIEDVQTLVQRVQTAEQTEVKPNPGPVADFVAIAPPGQSFSFDTARRSPARLG